MIRTRPPDSRANLNAMLNTLNPSTKRQSFSQIAFPTQHPVLFYSIPKNFPPLAFSGKRKSGPPIVTNIVLNYSSGIDALVIDVVINNKKGA